MLRAERRKLNKAIEAAEVAAAAILTVKEARQTFYMELRAFLETISLEP